MKIAFFFELVYSLVYNRSKQIMKKFRKLNKELCFELAKQYNSINELKKKDNSLYKSIKKNKWDDCFSHMENKRQIIVRQLFETINACSTLSEFRTNHRAEYRMVLMGKLFKRLDRFDDIKLVTKNVAIQDSNKYPTINIWVIKSPHSYIKAKIEKWDDCFTKFKNSPTIEYTKEYCIQNSKLYTSRVLLKEHSQYLYKVIVRNNWQDECFSHMKKWKRIKQFKTQINHDDCKKIALKYTERKAWLQNEPYSFRLAEKRKWTDCFDHFPPSRTNIFKSKDDCMNDALNYKTRSDWSRHSTTAYRLAKKNKWEECFAHMIDMRIRKNRLKYIGGFF